MQKPARPGCAAGVASRAARSTPGAAGSGLPRADSLSHQV